MTNEEKQLLLKDLCARLPYEVQCEIGGLQYGPYTFTGNYVEYLIAGRTFKPYLRPMSSMTEEEKKYISERCGFSIAGPIRNECELIMPVLAADWLIDFYNEYHIDYRGLIPMGLALEAPKDMYEKK